jgi:hypothetical protein
MSAPSLPCRLLRVGGLLMAFAAISPVVLPAQEAPKKELSDKVSEGFGKLRELTEAKKYAEALALIDGLLANAKPDSYDLTLLSQIKVQVLLSDNRYAESIAPMEVALRLGKAYNFIEKRTYLEFTQILSQLYFQEASNAKLSEQVRADYFKKAYETIKVYLKENEKPTPESLAYAATMIYTQATMDPAKVDAKLVLEAKTLANKGLLLSLKPREGFYVLILAALQQEGKAKESAEVLELLVSENPTNAQYWQQLQATYINLANAANVTEQESLEWNVRTVLTIERAQNLGLLNTPRDHFNMVGILMNIKQFDQAIILLEKGLQEGKIENTKQNWEYLASSYQQVHKELKAIDILKQASTQFPTDGSLDFRIANIYYTMDKMTDAYTAGKAALAKGNLDNLPATQMFVAYMGYELKKYDEALPFAEAAKAAGTDNADRLFEAIQTAIAERKAALEATI